MTSEARLSALIAPAFHELHRDMKREGHAQYWLRGGRGSGKSSVISLEILLGMLRDKNANAIVYRRVGNTLKDSVYGQIIWAADMLGITGQLALRVSPLEISFRKTGQRILFRGADQPMKSKSIKLTKGYFKYLWFEELAEFRGMEDLRVIEQSVFRGVDRAFTLYSGRAPGVAGRHVLAARGDAQAH